MFVYYYYYYYFYRRQEEKPKEEPKPPPKASPKDSPRPASAKFRRRPELTPPRHTVINVPEPDTKEEVAVNNTTQTSDTVGIQTERKLLEEYDHVSGNIVIKT